MKRDQLLSLIVVLTILLFASSTVATAQEDGDPLSNGDVKKLLKASGKSLKKAENALDQDNPGQAAEHAARYSETMATISDALARGNVREDDFLKVIERVDKATLKHEAKLTELLDKVPEQARPAIERALENSRTGHDRATEALLNRSQAELNHGMLDRRSAEATGKKNDALLKHAERAQKRGDNATVDRTVGQVVANTNTLSDAIGAGAVDNRDAEAVFDRVDRNTRRQMGKLEDLLGKVPERARPNIERAIQESARGRQSATQALQRSRAANTQAGWLGGRGGNPGIGGRPSGAGAGGGRPSGAGGGPPSGRPGGKPPR